MKIRGSLLMALLIIGILSSVVMPSVNAEIFDIGEIVESDAIRTPFSSGVYVYGDPNNATEIFDGNLSTGIDWENNSIFSLYFELHFPHPIYVNNLTAKTSFAGGKSLYSLELKLNEGMVYLGQNLNDDIFLSLNCSINYIELYIWENGTDHFYFNDVIINYSPISTNLSEAIQAINELTNTVIYLQNQINNLTSQIDMLNNTINELNNTINELNQTQHQILENVTELYEIQYLIDQITQDIHKLNESITEIKNTMPSEYNDTTLLNRVFQLESKNAALSLEIENLTTEIEKLKEAEEEPDDFVVLVPFALSILGILIAIVAIIFASRKLGEKTPSGDKDESEESIHSEEDENKANEEKT